MDAAGVAHTTRDAVDRAQTRGPQASTRTIVRSLTAARNIEDTKSTKL